MSELLRFSQLQVRPAQSQDRRQIRHLLRNYHRQASQSNLCRSSPWKYFSLGLGLALLLHWLVMVGGLQSLYWSLLVAAILTLLGWANPWLFEDWQHYWVIEQNQRLIACAKLTCYRTYILLSDVVVAIDRRQIGVGSQLLATIVQRVNPPIYLACRPELVRFYARFGFQPANPQELTAYLRQELGLQEQQLQVLWRPELPISRENS